MRNGYDKSSPGRQGNVEGICSESYSGTSFPLRSSTRFRTDPWNRPGTETLTVRVLAGLHRISDDFMILEVWRAGPQQNQYINIYSGTGGTGEGMDLSFLPVGDAGHERDQASSFSESPECWEMVISAAVAVILPDLFQGRSSRRSVRLVQLQNQRRFQRISPWTPDLGGQTG